MSLGENYYYGGLLRFDLSPKPAYYKIKDLIQRVWHTEGETVTNEQGNTAFRGFFGQYELEITANGKTVKRSLSLSSKSDNRVTIVL